MILYVKILGYNKPLLGNAVFFLLAEVSAKLASYINILFSCFQRTACVSVSAACIPINPPL